MSESENNTPIEPHFTVNDIAKWLKLSDDTVRRMFINEPGVLKIGGGTRLVKRKYVHSHFTLRIPESVFLRVQDRLMNKRRPEGDPDVLFRGSARRRGLHAS
ncbi:MAG: hypothetical protein ABSD53_12525 [Terriglobales bacterium]|jgi:hypothetical protein